LKERIPIIWTEAGIETETSERQSLNASSAIRESLDPDSNVTTESEWQSLKQFSSKSSTEAGIQTDRNDSFSTEGRHLIIVIIGEFGKCNAPSDKRIT
jgi:hypothetical protein